MSEIFAHIKFEDAEIDATAENTALYTHLGASAMMNHVWIKLDENRGARIWEQIPPDNPFYEQLAPIVAESGAELHINLRKASQCDTDAFEKALFKDIDKLPDWLPEV
jgi:hypothetical protein